MLCGHMLDHLAQMLQRIGLRDLLRRARLL
jgi:hypothetical protein